MENQAMSNPMDYLSGGNVNHVGKRTLRSHAAVMNPAPSMSAEDVLNLRLRLRLSRALFACYLRTNVRTLENWEQGRASPNAQAILLLLMVEQFPDTVARLAKV